MSDVLYRYDTVRWSFGVDQFDEPIPGHRLTIECNEYPVSKRTPQGAWIETGGRLRFVKLTAHKQYACETRELAANSFRHRKLRQIRILQAQLADAEKALKLLELDFNASCKNYRCP